MGSKKEAVRLAQQAVKGAAKQPPPLPKQPPPLPKQPQSAIQPGRRNQYLGKTGRHSRINTGWAGQSYQGNGQGMVPLGRQGFHTGGPGGPPITFESLIRDLFQWLNPPRMTVADVSRNISEAQKNVILEDLLAKSEAAFKKSEAEVKAVRAEGEAKIEAAKVEGKAEVEVARAEGKAEVEVVRAEGEATLKVSDAAHQEAKAALKDTTAELKAEVDSALKQGEKINIQQLQEALKPLQPSHKATVVATLMGMGVTGAVTLLGAKPLGMIKFADDVSKYDNEDELEKISNNEFEQVKEATKKVEDTLVKLDKLQSTLYYGDTKEIRQLQSQLLVDVKDLLLKMEKLGKVADKHHNEGYNEMRQVESSEKNLIRAKGNLTIGLKLKDKGNEVLKLIQFNHEDQKTGALGTKINDAVRKIIRPGACKDQLRQCMEKLTELPDYNPKITNELIGDITEGKAGQQSSFRYKASLQREEAKKKNLDGEGFDNDNSNDNTDYSI